MDVKSVITYPSERHGLSAKGSCEIRCLAWSSSGSIARVEASLDAGGSWRDAELYAVVAYLLAVNGIIDEARELSDSTVPEVRMPNRDSFVPASETDLRPEPSRAVDGE